MPILGLFPTEAESSYNARVNSLAGGAESPAVKELRRGGELAKKQAFANAYAARGNQALSRRQANQTASQIATETSSNIGMQRQADIDAARAEQQRLEQQRIQGINNAIGMIPRGAAMLLGGPAAGGVAKTATSALTGGIQQALQPSQATAPRAITQASTQAAYNPLTGAGMGSPVSNEDIMSLAGPRQPAAPMRQDLQQYMDPNVIMESAPRLSTDVSGLAQGVREQLTPEYLLQGLDPRLLRGIRQTARR